MKLPRGRLVRSRVVGDLRTVLADALDRDLTGYAAVEPQDALLLGGDGAGVVTFRAGVPVAAYHTGTERGGPPALADLAANGPYRLELLAADREDLADVHDVEEFRVPPGMPAERLAGDQELADRTRAAARAGQTGSTADDEIRAPVDDADDRVGAVEAFLDDAEKIAAIKEEARAEAEERAAEWGFDDLA